MCIHYISANGGVGIHVHRSRPLVLFLRELTAFRKQGRKQGVGGKEGQKDRKTEGQKGRRAEGQKGRRKNGRMNGERK
jgi:hypothetical protein